MQNAITGDEMRSQQNHTLAETIDDYDPWDSTLCHPNPAGWTDILKGMQKVGGYDIEQVTAILNTLNLDETHALLEGKKLPTQTQVRMILNMIKKFTLLSCGPYAYNELEREGLIFKSMTIKGMTLDQFADYLNVSPVALRGWVYNHNSNIPDDVWGVIARIVAGSDIA